VARGIWLIAFTGAALYAQAQQQEPPEEDATLIEKKEYTFNPLQAENEIKIGKFYMKKASYKAAIQRFTEATKWNPNSPEAWLALGDAYEKGKDLKNAKQAYAKYIELAPDAKNAPAIKKKL
jgi:tetratricopeptide (TPR) repeat protein